VATYSGFGREMFRARDLAAFDASVPGSIWESCPAKGVRRRRDTSVT
jgi:hypothetical protein